MGCFVFDYNYTKDETHIKANSLCKKFLKQNNLDYPKILLTSEDNRYKALSWSHYGWYDFSREILYVNVKKSRPPTKTPGFSWSFPCSKVDLTACGITAHEYGHHVHHILNKTNKISQKDLFSSLKKIKRLEKKITNYEPNLSEMFAETMRLFILNPDLLEKACPNRWNFIANELNLTPVHQKKWEYVLKNAHEKILQANYKWIEK